MFCAYCGKELPPNVVFCPYCGTKGVNTIENDVNTNTDSPLPINTAEISEDSIQTGNITDKQDNKTNNSKKYAGVKAYIASWIIVKILEEITVWISHQSGYYGTFSNILFIIVMVELLLLPIIPIVIDLKNKRDNIIPTILLWIAVHYAVIKAVMFITDMIRRVN